jgi:uncharacterized protein YbcV (DUF1398 family)
MREREITMNAQARQVMHACSAGSLDGSMTFPEVVGRLAAIGCEQYHADFRRQEKTYYLPDGQSEVAALPVEVTGIPSTFADHALVAALRTIQAGQITYVEFLRRIMAAGCVGYFDNIAGKRAIYFGRNGESYVEVFPAS